MRSLNNFDLRNVISNPTRVAANSETTIDLCLVSNMEKVETGVLHLGVSDHGFIYACYDIKKEKGLPYIKTIKDFKGADIEKLNTRIEQAPWSVCSIFDDIDDCVWAWESTRILSKRKHLKEKLKSEGNHYLG